MFGIFFFGCWFHGHGLGLPLPADVPLFCLFTVFAGHLHFTVVSHFSAQAGGRFLPTETESKCKPSHHCWAWILKLVVFVLQINTDSFLFLAVFSAVDGFYFWKKVLLRVLLRLPLASVAKPMMGHSSKSRVSLHSLLFWDGSSASLFSWELNCQIIEPTVHDQPKNTEENRFFMVYKQSYGSAVGDREQWTLGYGQFLCHLFPPGHSEGLALAWVSEKAGKGLEFLLCPP